MIINRLGSEKSKRASSAYFTGVAWQDPIIEAPAPSMVRALKVSFEPGARTAWHTHPLGQTLHILSGLGRVQVADEPVREVRAGDTVYFAPQEKHWHGASPDVAMVHLAIQEAKDGRHVDWLSHVTDEEYAGPPVPMGGQ
jgi:quercetin dioxygenase-like cupin family protein